MLTEIAEQINLFLLFETVSLSVLQKLLFPLESDFLSEGKSVAVLCPLLLRSRTQPDVEIEIFPFAVMLDFLFRSSGHRSLGIEYGISFVIQNRSFGASEIILKREARPTVFKDGLHKFRILFVLCFDFCHK